MDVRRVIYQLGSVTLIAASFLLAAYLALDSLGIVGSHTVLTRPWLSTVYLISISLGPLLALLLVGLLAYLAVTYPFPGRRIRASLIVIAGILLVLSIAALTMRHGILVKATGRAPEDHFPMLRVFLALGIGIVFILNRKKNSRLVGGIFLAVVPPLIILAFGLGLRFDPHAITEVRAIQIGQAIERYHQDTGEYPADLEQLQPDYLYLLLGPLTGRGQTWCYQSGPGYFRLGYVLFERYHQYADGTPFWEPYYEIKVPRSAGELPAGTWSCDNELERMKRYGGLVNLRMWIDYAQLNGQGG